MRLKGWILLLKGDLVDAERNFLTSLDRAPPAGENCGNYARRPAFARLWQSQGKRQEADQLLAPVYGWFTEGFDTKDLQEAQSR